jgi:lysine-specific demethylase/histidyl-hydroxylase NO66
VTTPVTTAATTRTPAPSNGASAPPPRGALELTLEPLDADAFRAEYWERRPLVVQRAESGRFDAVLSRDDVERLVCETGIRAPAFRRVRVGRPFPQREYAETVPWRPRGFTETAIVDRVAEEFERGATIVLQGLHHHWQPAALYCRELVQGLGCRVQANAYYTPSSAQGFAVHHAPHDGFVLPLAGS